MFAPPRKKWSWPEISHCTSSGDWGGSVERVKGWQEARSTRLTEPHIEGNVRYEQEVHLVDKILSYHMGDLG